MAGYITFWSKEHIRKLEKARDTGPLSVIYGSHHTKMPSIAAVHMGDMVYPTALLQGTLCVMARLPVERIEPALDYLMREVGYPGGALIPEGTALERVLSCKPEAFAFSAVKNAPDAFFQLSDGTRIESGQPAKGPKNDLQAQSISGKAPPMPPGAPDLLRGPGGQRARQRHPAPPPAGSVSGGAALRPLQGPRKASAAGQKRRTDAGLPQRLCPPHERGHPGAVRSPVRPGAGRLSAGIDGS